MTTLGLSTDIVDEGIYARAVARFKEAGIRLPTLAQLADPSTIPSSIVERLADVDPDAPDPLNLFRVHWFNAANRKSRVDVPGHLVLPESLTGVPSPIVVLLGERFPMITAHKVLAAYGCLAPRLVTGQFDPTAHKALWPSTGNYCRGGVAISRIMGCRGVAILPEGMSRERFDWLEHWVADPADIVRTPGTESNVKEIYDKCAELDQVPGNVIFNQFAEFSNHLVHYACTGRAIGTVIDHLGLDLVGFTSATGSAGTIAAGDYLKDHYGAKIVALEALECPTLLENGFGEHNIQGIGDKHVPLIHNVMNTDYVAAVSDRATDELEVLFTHPEGHRYLVERRGVPQEIVDQLPLLGFSAICNIIGAIKLAKHMQLGPDQALATVATDGANLYTSERDRTLAEDFGGRFDQVSAAEVFSQHLAGASIAHLKELSLEDRRRIFNLGYFTWVEQQGVSLSDFVARRDQSYWVGLRELMRQWDARIEQFNADTGIA